MRQHNRGLNTGSANKNGTMPDHAPRGPGMDAVSNVSVLGTIDDPVINWVGSEDGGVTTYGSLIWTCQRTWFAAMLRRNAVQSVTCLLSSSILRMAPTTPCG